MTTSATRNEELLHFRNVTWIDQTYSDQIDSKILSLIIEEASAAVITPQPDHSSILFDTHQKAPPWATFQAPDNLLLSSKRCFHPLSILPFFNFDLWMRLLENQKSKEIEKIKKLFNKLEELNRILENIYLQRNKFQKG